MGAYKKIKKVKVAVLIKMFGKHKFSKKVFLLKKKKFVGYKGID